MTIALSPITPTIEQMEEYLGPNVNIPSHWSRAKQKDIIELIYYQRRVNEVMDRHKGSFWSQETEKGPGGFQNEEDLLHHLQDRSSFHYGS